MSTAIHLHITPTFRAPDNNFVKKAFFFLLLLLFILISYYPFLPRPNVRGSNQLVSFKDTELQRLRFFEACLATARLPYCRPLVPLKLLPRTEWRAHTSALIISTAPARRQPYSQYGGYAGPWGENEFISHFLGTESRSEFDSSNISELLASSAFHRLEEVFYPAVPLFAQWTDLRHSGARPPKGPNELQRLFRNLRSDVLYVMLTTHDRGDGAVGLACKYLANVLLFSAGGWGNVAIPLIKGETPHRRAMDGASWQERPRSVLFVFIGTNWLGREVVMSTFSSGSASLPMGSRFFYSMQTSQWQSNVSRAVFALAPRGFGRTSYRLYELLQHGTLPIYLHDDDVETEQAGPWVPFQNSVFFGFPRNFSRDLISPLKTLKCRNFGQSNSFTLNDDIDPARSLLKDGMWGPGGMGFAVSYREVPAFLCIACDFLREGSAARWRHMRTLPLSEYGPEGACGCPCTKARWDEVAPREDGRGIIIPSTSLVSEMERRIGLHSHRYFTYEAVNKHIESFMRHPRQSELICVPKPATFGVPTWSYTGKLPWTKIDEDKVYD